jgi:DNA-binding transcriptional regulator YbjK
MEYNEKKIRLIEVAEMLFAKNGYAETSIRDIAKHADVNSAMISYYFGSKEKLIEAIFIFRTTDLSKFFKSVDANSKDYFESVIVLINLYVDKVFEQQNFYRLLFQIQAIEKDYLLLDYFNHIRYSNYQTLENYFSLGKKNGQFKTDFDITFLVSTMVGTINHMFFNQNHYKKINKYETSNDSDFINFYKSKMKAHIEQLVRSIVF